MALNTQDFTALVRNMVTAAQGSCSKLVDMTIGSILRSIFEANAAIGLWLQSLILQLLATTRAATCAGADLDTWMADYGLERLAAVPASGLVTFSRFTPTQQAIVPIGASIQSADGSQAYIVQLDTANPAYSASLGGYAMAAGVSSVNVPVTAAVAGAGGNASIGQISVITQAMPGVDTVTNSAAFTNGVDKESDAAFLARFQTYIASLSKGTKGAVEFAITSLQQGVTCAVVENYQYGGAVDNGYFYAVVDDGTGYPTSTFLSSASNAIDAVRAFTSRFGVFAPSVLTATVAMTITTGTGYVHANVVTAVQTALQNYINSLTLGQALPYSKLAQIAYEASPGVTNVTGVTLNDGTADMAATSQQVIKHGTVTVS